MIKDTPLTRLTMVVKKIIYNPERFKIFLKMLGSQHGAVQAVHTVLAIINKKRPIPPELISQLGVNAYLAMVDVAVDLTKHNPDPQIVHNVIQEIISQTFQKDQMAANASQQPSQPASPQPQSQGIIGQKMGAMA